MTTSTTTAQVRGCGQTVILGGVSQHPQVAALSRPIDIVVATPGRLLDLCEQGHVGLAHITHFILDEADRMLDMGFIHDVKKIIRQLPARRQSLLFSATMPPAVASLAQQLLHGPTRVEVTPAATTVATVQQFVYFVNAADKSSLLRELLRDSALSRVLVFARTKHRANRVAERISKQGVEADALHGNKSQNARQRALERFRTGDSRVLVATDIAARGLDVDGISHVINFELPHEPESYVHRIGRTARAGASGCALSFCDPGDETAQLRGIEKLTGIALETVRDQPFDVTPAAPEPQRRRRGGVTAPVTSAVAVAARAAAAGGDGARSRCKDPDATQGVWICVGSRVGRPVTAGRITLLWLSSTRCSATRCRGWDTTCSKSPTRCSRRPRRPATTGSTCRVIRHGWMPACGAGG